MSVIWCCFRCFTFPCSLRLSKNWKLWAAPTVGFALIQLLQVYLYRNHFPAGNRRNRCGGYHVRELCAALCVEPDCLYLRNQCGTGAFKWTELPGSAAVGDHSHCPGRSDDRDAGAGFSDPGDSEGKEDGTVLAEGISVCGIYRSLYRLLQRDHPCGDALGICFPGSSSAIPVLDVRQSRPSRWQSGAAGSRHFRT